MVMVYFASAGDTVSEMSIPHPLPEVREITDGRFVHRGDHAFGEVNMHIIEFAENSADSQHFETIHGDMLIPWTRIRIPGIRVRHVSTWSEDPHHSEFSTFDNEVSLRVRGREVPHAGARARVSFLGPGGLVRFWFEIPDLGQIVLFHTLLPVKPLKQMVNFRWFAEPSVPRLVVSYVVGSWVSQWASDVPVWENKIYQPRPPLSPLDGPVAQMRKWYRQFYRTPPPSLRERVASADHRAADH